MTTRVPLPDNAYVQLIGRAHYMFLYYEWTLICIIDCLDSGFRSKYCRKRKITSSGVRKEFKHAIEKYSSPGVDPTRLEDCCRTFNDLIQERNALAHAHPVTLEGSQLLIYQSLPGKTISDKKWTQKNIEDFIQKIDEASVEANQLLHQLPSLGLASGSNP